MVAEPVSLRDLPATVLDLLGLGRGAAFPGRSLARFWDPGDGAARPAFEPLLMETDKPTLLTNQGREPAAKGPMKAMVAGGMHYIRSGDGSEELYALDADPEERTNLAGLPEAQRGLSRGFEAPSGRCSGHARRVTDGPRARSRSSPPRVSRPSSEGLQESGF